MRWLLALTLLATVASADDNAGRFHRFCRDRSSRGFLCDSEPFFSAFPASGAGTTTACSTTAPTGARGEALTFTRASNGTCTNTAAGGLATTGIADGDLVVLSSNVARVEYDSAGTLGLLVEAQGINLLPRFDALTNAAWSDVGTPTVTDGATDPFGGTTGDAIDDNDAAAYEGRSQPITVSAGAAHIAYCYVKAGTLSAARITLDGTATNITGLSATTWSIVQVADASSSGVSIVVQVLAGSAASDTGTVIFGGCDAKTGAVLTSIVPTVAASATRVVETAKIAIATAQAIGASSSLSLYIDIPGATADTGWAALEGGTTYRMPGFGAGVTRFEATAHIVSQAGVTSGLTKRAVGGEGATSFACAGGTCSAGGAITSSGTPTFFWVGDYNVGAPGTRTAPGIYSRLCWQPDSATRCR